jgi:glycosyltransferase involved in cell wall biosynthesis
MRTLAVVTSWGSRCGIAEYSRSLLEAVPAGVFSIHVLADRDPTATDVGTFPVARCWDKGSAEIGGILEAIDRVRPDLVLVESNWGYLDIEGVGALIEAMAAKRVRTVVQLHAVYDHTSRGVARSLASIAGSLALASRVVVHGARDEARVRELCPGCRIERTVLGQREFPDEPREDVRRSLGIQGCAPILSSFGFLLPHKGILETIRAVGLMRETRSDAAFVGACSVIRGNRSSVLYSRICDCEIRRTSLRANAAIVSDYLSETVAMTLLHAADVIVLPYLPTGESASASVRFALSSSRPVVTSSEHIFDDLGDAVLRIGEVTPRAIADAVRAVLDDADLADGLVSAACALTSAASWPRLGEALIRMLQELTPEPRG